MAFAMAALSVNILLGGCEIGERRPDLAKIDRAQFSLRNATPARLGELVHPSIASLVSTVFCRIDVFHRTGGPISHFRAASIAPDGLRGDGWAPNIDLPDRQLHLFQHPDNRALRLAPG